MNRDSVVYIGSSTNSSFGSGFVIDKDKNGVFILTCQHVLDEVVIPIINNIEADVIARGNYNIDMALLYLRGVQLKPFSLQRRDCDSLDVEVIGFSHFNKTLNQKKYIYATLYDKPIELSTKSGELSHNARKIEVKNGFDFEKGNSGSPVICKSSGNVIAMLSNKKGSNIGYAVDISNLKKIWTDMPSKLLLHSSTTYKLPIKKYFIYFILLIISIVIIRISYCNSEQEEFDSLYYEIDKLDALWEKSDSLDTKISVNAKTKIQNIEKFANRIVNNIDDKCLLLRFQIFKYEKVSYAYIIIADIQKYSNEKKILARKSITMGKKAIDLIKTVSKGTTTDKWIEDKNIKQHIDLIITEGYAMLVKEGENSLIAETTRRLKRIRTWYERPDQGNKLRHIEWFIKHHPYH
jgi:hypothetical protein